MPRRLTLKQSAFVDAYVTNGGNGARAYREAGYKAPNPAAAATGAHKLVTSPHIDAAITRQQGDLQAQSYLTAHDVIAGLLEIARSEDTASARVSAWSKIADILGLVVRQSRVDVRERTESLSVALDGKSVDELAFRCQGLRPLRARRTASDSAAQDPPTHSHLLLRRFPAS